MIVASQLFSLCRAVDLALSFYNSYQPNQAPTALCTRGSNGLNLDQKNECFLQPDASLAIAEGAVYGLQECSRQLSNRRWNCPHLTGQLFKNGLQRSEWNFVRVNVSENLQVCFMPLFLRLHNLVITKLT